MNKFPTHRRPEIDYSDLIGVLTPFNQRTRYQDLRSETENALQHVEFAILWKGCQMASRDVDPRREGLVKDLHGLYIPSFIENSHVREIESRGNIFNRNTKSLGQSSRQLFNAAASVGDANRRRSIAPKVSQSFTNRLGPSIGYCATKITWNAHCAVCSSIFDGLVISSVAHFFKLKKNQALFDDVPSYMNRVTFSNNSCCAFLFYF